MVLAAGMFAACSNLDNEDHYSKTNSLIESTQVEVVDESSAEYLMKTQEYSSMSQLFQEQGIFDELKKKGQLSTILVVDNDNFVMPEGDADEVKNTTRSHISDASLSPANLKTEKNDMRVMMWHGKYVNVTIDETMTEEGKTVDQIFFNTSVVEKIIKTSTGFIYVISDMIDTPKSLNDFINGLDDNYSILRDSIKSSGGKEFDRKNSKPIGVNSEGNTVYDSVFIYTNTHFEEQGMDLSSESLTATMFLCSNKVIEEAIADAKRRIDMWDLSRDWNMDRENTFDYTVRHWIMDAAFYNQQYSAEEVSSKDPENLLTSVFGKVWKTAAQDVDVEAIELSNAIVYNVKKLHIPNSVLIYRLKEDFFIYELCSAEQKEAWFQTTNMDFKNCNTDVAAWSPLSGVWPNHENRCLIMKAGENASDFWQMDFTPCKRVFREICTRKEFVKNNKTKNQLDVDAVTPFLIPPGKYRLAFGSKQGQNLDVQLTVFLKVPKSEEYPNGLKQIAQSGMIQLGSSTTYHYDRGATLSNAYPEGFNTKAEGMSSKAGNYDTDGGIGIDEVEIPDVKGDGTPAEIVIRFYCPTWGTQTSMLFNHWCLRPLADNY